MSLSNSEQSNEGPRSDPGGIVRSVDFTSVVEQSSQGPVIGRITGSARKGVKRKLDNKSLEMKYEVLMEVEKETDRRPLWTSTEHPIYMAEESR